MTKILRKWVYTQYPEVYEMAGCPTCRNYHTEWSEYEKHLWCAKCKIDFIPEHCGIFDGPIPIGVCRLLGIKFNRINLETREVEIFNTETLKYPSAE